MSIFFIVTGFIIVVVTVLALMALRDSAMHTLDRW